MHSHLLVKLAAVASSLLLGAAFVSYRAGVLQWSPGSSDQSVETTPPADHTTEVGPAAATDPDSAIFASSKSGAVFVEEQPSPEPAPAPQQAAPPRPPTAVILSGSKSLMPAPPNYQQGAVQSQQTNGNSP